MRQAQSVLEQADNIREIAKRGKDPLAGPLRLGVIYTIGPYLLPDLVRQAIAKTPQMPLMLQENFTVKLLEELRTGEIDCAILAEPFPDANLAIAPLYDEPFMAAVPSGHPLAALKGVTAEELKKRKPCCCWAPATAFATTCSRSAPSSRAFPAAPRASRKSFEGSSLETIKHMVAAGMGITLVPRLGVPKEALLEPAPAKKAAKGKAAAPETACRPSSPPSSNTCPSTAMCPAGGWYWPGGAASRAMRPLPRCAMPSTPASCPASSACLESRL